MHTVSTNTRAPELPAWLNPEFVTGEHLARRDDLTARLDTMLREHVDLLVELREFYFDVEKLVDGLPDEPWAALWNILIGPELDALAINLGKLASYDSANAAIDVADAAEQIRAAS